jgi:hypothetical protein
LAVFFGTTVGVDVRVGFAAGCEVARGLARVVRDGRATRVDPVDPVLVASLVGRGAVVLDAEGVGAFVAGA